MNPNPTPPSPYFNPRVQELTNNLSMHSLFAKIVETPLDRELSITTMKSSIKGLIDLEELGNDWFLLRFATEEDRYLCKPHLVQGQLLAICPWSHSFNPFKQQLTKVDLWARIPLLPLPLFHDEALQIILSHNNVGDLADIDYVSNTDNKMRFARVLISVDLSRPLVRMVSFLDGDESTVHLRVWYEGYSPGCGCCGEEDHVFDDCPLNSVQPRRFGVVLEEANPVQEALIKQSRRMILGGEEAESVEDGKRKEAEDSVASTAKKPKKENN